MASGATLTVTEMQPWPPWAMYPNAVASSPDSSTKSSPHSRRMTLGRAMSEVASLMPAMLGSLASRATVSLDMSTLVRAGTL